MTNEANSSRGRLPNGTPNPIDVHVGNRIRIRRTLLKLSQEKLADLLGLTFQQIQKYERGTNRVGASRLWDISKALGVNVSYFYEDMSTETASQSPMLLRGIIDMSVLDDTIDPMQKEETIELVTSFYKIKNPALAESLLNAIKEAAKNNYLGNEE